MAYEKYGNKILLFGFFLPGVKLIFNGYFAGIIQVPFRTFVLYAYIGSALWVSIFISIGYMFGNQWQLVFTWIEHFLKLILVILCCIIAIFLLWKRRSWFGEWMNIRRRGIGVNYYPPD